MSRCVAFPPPGYVWNGVSGEALVKLLKVRKERVLAEKERKKKKKRNGETKKESEPSESNQKRRRHSRKHNYGRSKNGQEGSDNQKKQSHETQTLENSSLTEEVGHPIIYDSQYDSSDNSQNIKKIKPIWSPQDYHNKCTKGSTIQSDFHLHKHTDPELSSCEPFRYTPTSTNAVHKKLELASRPSSTSNNSSVTLEMTPTPHRELGSSHYLCTELPAYEKAERAPVCTLSDIKSKTESRFRELIVNWVPPVTQSAVTDFDDQEWLSKRTLPRSEVTENTKASDADLYDGSSTLYTCARYLPQADVYVLPFTLLF